jgi:DNA repair exonuclease SbcCD nuclease subunit
LEFRVLHTSDLHLGEDGSPDVAALRSIMRVASAQAVSAIILAGDIFDNNRVPLNLVDKATKLLGDGPFPVIVLPGNHDCLGDGSVYQRSGIADPSNVHVLGVTDPESVLLANLDLEVAGRAHRDYLDMAPLEESASGRSARWRIAVAHGHWTPGRREGRAWEFSDQDIRNLDADYLALGHWDVAASVGSAGSLAWYSGSPQIAKSVNIVSLTESEGARVTRFRLDRLD